MTNFLSSSAFRPLLSHCKTANGAGVVFSAAILKDFVIPKLFKTTKYVICPVIDMANHDAVPQAEVSFEFFANGYSLAIQGGSGVSPGQGQEVRINYGARSNDQLLQYYGFVLKDNPCDVYVMPPLREWEIDAIEKACGRKVGPGRLEKLDRAGLLGRKIGALSSAEDDGSDDDSGKAIANPEGGVVVTRVDGIDPAVFQALRALLSTDTEWDAAGQAVGNFAEALNAENEACARLAAKTALEQELASKSSSLGEDEKLLRRMDTVKSMDLSTFERLAITFRIEKKKILMETIDKLA